MCQRVQVFLEKLTCKQFTLWHNPSHLSEVADFHFLGNTAIKQHFIFQAKRKRPPPKSRDPPCSDDAKAAGTPENHEETEETALPSWYKERLLASEGETVRLKKKIKYLQQTKRRLQKRHETAQDIISTLKKRKLLSDEGAEVFSAAFSSNVQQLLYRAAAEKKGKFPPELRTFALTLHFYSPAAYEYVRAKFNDALPSQRTIREWYRSLDGRPGFTAEAFSFSENLVQTRTGVLYCALIVDDMALRKHVELVGDRVVGYVDFGAGLEDDSLPEARNACVYVLVGVNMRLKVPIGYFLIDSLTGSERAELTKQCIEKLNSVGVEVISLTFDGASSNFSMAESLGAHLRLNGKHFSTCFENPADSSKKVHIMLDACHII